MVTNKIVTSKRFRLWNVTTENVYMHAVVLDKIEFRYTYGGIKIFHLRERLFKDKISHLLNLKQNDKLAILYGKIANPSQFDETQVVASFATDFIRQTDIQNIMAMSSEDLRVVEVVSQIGVKISQGEIEAMLEIMEGEK